MIQTYMTTTLFHSQLELETRSQTANAHINASRIDLDVLATDVKIAKLLDADNLTI